MAAGAASARGVRAPRPTVVHEAARVRQALQAQARPPGAFDPTRYFRPSSPFGFLNVRTPVVRALGRSAARSHRDDWSIEDVIAFADLLVKDVHLEVKGAGIASLEARRRELRPSHLGVFKRWLAQSHAANWATTDGLSGALIAPLLDAHPRLIPMVAAWAGHRNLWVRRAAAVSLVKLAARGAALDAAYAVATSLRDDPHDLIHKAVGWLLREAGRTDPQRLERYLLAGGPAIPRTTVRYAVERWPLPVRQALLQATRPAGATPGPVTRVSRGTRRRHSRRSEIR